MYQLAEKQLTERSADKRWPMGLGARHLQVKIIPNTVFSWGLFGNIVQVLFIQLAEIDPNALNFTVTTK